MHQHAHVLSISGHRGGTHEFAYPRHGRAHPDDRRLWPAQLFIQLLRADWLPRRDEIVSSYAKPGRWSSMKIKAQMAMVMNLDKCLACHTCTIPCKNAWTTPQGRNISGSTMWETKPGIGYPRRWEDEPGQMARWLGAEARAPQIEVRWWQAAALPVHFCQWRNAGNQGLL